MKKLKSIVTSTDLGLTEGKEYDMLFEYETVYKVKLDNGNIACRNKGFFTGVSYTYVDLFERFKRSQGTIQHLAGIVQNEHTPSREDLGEYEYEFDKFITEMKNLKEDVLNFYKKD